jgi:hypothetical protein
MKRLRLATGPITRRTRQQWLGIAREGTLADIALMAVERSLGRVLK